jgi:hypothetical protein
VGALGADGWRGQWLFLPEERQELWGGVRDWLQRLLEPGRNLRGEGYDPASLEGCNQSRCDSVRGIVVDI